MNLIECEVVNTPNPALSETLPGCPRLADCLIHHHRFFQHLDDQALASLCRRSQLLTLAPQQMLFNQGEPGRRFFMVLSGTVKFFRSSYGGSERVLGSAGPGDIIGENAACVSGGRYDCFAQVLEQATLRAFNGVQLRQRLQQQPGEALELVHYLTQSLTENVNSLEMLGSQNARDRLIRFLLRHLTRDYRGQYSTTLTLPKALTASQLAMQPETLSRLLSELHRTGVIHMQHRHIQVPDLSLLESQLL